MILVYGSSDGLQLTAGPGFQKLDQDDVPVVGVDPGPDYRFGATLAAGDFDDEGYDDLFVAIPGDPGSGTFSGRFMIFDGSSSGVLTTLGNFTGLVGVSSQPGIGSWGIAVGDVTGHRVPVVAVGIAYDSSGLANTGRLRLADLSTGFSLDTIDLSDLVDPPVADAFLGAAVAIADFDLDGVGDVVVGAPGLGLDGEPALSGAFFILPGVETLGPDPEDALAFALYDVGLLPTTADLLGSALVVGDFDGNGFPDLAAGVPNRNVAGQAAAGGVAITLNSGLFADSFESGNLLAWSAVVP